MPVKTNRSHDYEMLYRLRMLGCTVASILILIAFFKFWPLPVESETDPFPYRAGGQELISLEEVQPTRQSQKPPPPPPPIIPMLVPDDIVIENEIQFEDAYLTLEEYGDDQDIFQAEGDANAGSAKAPEIGPRPLKFVEPKFPKAAQRKRVKAEVVIEVMVDEKGRVLDAKIIERILYSDSSKKKKVTVPSLSHGLEESALSAAKRWTFRPALANGLPVQSYYTMTFSFGV